MKNYYLIVLLHILIPPDTNGQCLYSADYYTYNNFCDLDSVYVMAHPLNGTGPYTYLWSTGDTTQTISVPLVLGDYLVTITDSEGCSIVINCHVKPTPTVLFYPFNQNACLGDTVTLFLDWFRDSIPGALYEWSTGETTSTILITDDITWSATVTDPASGCEYVIPPNFFDFHPTPYPEIVGPSILCSGGSIFLTVTGGPFGEIVWFPGAFYEDTIEVLFPGTYTVWGSSPEANYCWHSDSIVITEGEINPPILSGPSELCNGQTGIITITNDDEYTSFLWSTNQTTPSITITQSGTYTVTVTETGGCSSSATITINPGSSNVNISGTTTPLTSCTSPNGTINITVVPAGSFTFNWSNGASTEDISDLSAGTYIVTVTDAGGCTSSSSFTVSSNIVLPTTSTNITGTTCSQSNGAIDLSVIPSGTYTFIWSNGQTTEDLSNILSGSYSVTVTANANGCTSTVAVTVPNTDPPINISGNTIPLTSCTSPNGAIDITSSPAGSYTYAWSNGATTEDIVNLPAGNYTITVSAGGSCTASTVFTVNNNTTPPLPVATSTAATCGQSNGAIDLNVTPVGTYTYLWSNGNNTEDLTAITGGNYTVTVTSTDGCTNTTSIVVPDNSIPITITGNTSPNTLCTGQNGSIDLSVSPPEMYTYLWSNGATTEDLSDLQAGMYNVTVTYGSTCTGTESFEVVSNINPINFTGTTSPNTSCSEPNGAIDLTISTPGSFTYLWSSGETIEDLQQLTGGTYSVTITGEDGCTASSVFEIINTNASYTLTGMVLPNNSCIAPNGSIDLLITPSGAYSYAWSNGASSEDVQNLISGNYNVTVTDINNCSSVAVFSVEDSFSFPVLSAILTPASCGGNNGSIDLGITPANGNTYSWSNGVTTEDLTSVATGNYSVTVTGPDGCISSDTFFINDNSVFPVLSASITPAICGANNGTIDLAINPPGNYTFLWSTGATTEDILNLPPGIQSVVVTNEFGCQILDTFTVTNNNSNFSISAISGSNTSCITPNGTIDLTVTPTGTYTFLWSNGTSTEDNSNLAPGAYIVTVTDVSGCASIETFVVNDNTPVITISSLINPSLCGEGNGSIDLTVTPSNGNTFIWSNAAVSEDIQNLGSGDYIVTVTDLNGCTATETFSVPELGSSFSINGLLTANTNCTTPNGSIDLSVSPSGSYTYTWSDGTTSQDVANLLPGTYTVTVSDSNGCSATQSFNVTDQIILPEITELITPSVCGNANGQIDITVHPSGTYVFFWSDGSTGEDLFNVPSGNYAVTVTDGNGCSANSSFLVPNLNSNFSITGISAANTSCTTANGAIQLTVTPAGSYFFLWSNGVVTEDLFNLSSGSYTVTVTDASGCSSASNFNVNENIDDFIVDGTITPVLCGEPNGSIDLDITHPIGNSFIWSNGSATEDLDNILSGNYTVTVTAQNGCTWSESYNVPGSEKLELALETDVIQTGDEFVTLRALVNVSVNALDTMIWQPENLFNCSQTICLEQTITRPSQQTEIKVIAVDTNGCMAQARLLLDDESNPKVFIPNVFSPNNDGINDWFTVFGNADVDLILELRIFDRWGNFVFVNTEFLPNEENYGWDGSYRSSAMNPAVYAYWARVRFKDGSEDFYKGDVTLIR